MSESNVIDNGTDCYGVCYDELFPLVRSADFCGLEPRHWAAQWQPTVEFPTPQSVGADEFSQVTNDGISFSSNGYRYRLGEPTLPVAPYREHFLQTVADNQNVVVSSETGSGKSSQLGLYLLEAGAPRVFVTQPRIIAARELTERARENLGPDHEHLAGYLTGNAADSDCGPDARLIYVTEQLLFKMANRGLLQPDDIIINDEAHERTAPTVVFLGLMKDLLKDNPRMRLIVSSATIDTDLFSRYLTDAATGEAAPVMILPGRTHPVTREESILPVATVMSKLMNSGKNVLAFEPGLSRMKQTRSKAAGRKSGHTVHMLYGDQSPIEQKAALNPGDKQHIVATRIGETSITPQGKDAVVDSGLSNVGRYDAGVRGLKTVFSSQDTMKQRMGRVGRTKPGTYVLAIPSDTPPPPPFDERPAYESPAIQNSSVAPYIAELLRAGRRLEDLDLLESPTQENLHHDYLILQRLGATALEGGSVTLTAVGEATTDLPLDVPLARMLIEARTIELSSEQDRDALVLQAAAAVAVRQVNGIFDHGPHSQRRYMRHLPNKEPFSNEQLSDVLYELDVFASLFTKQKQAIAAGGSEPDFDRVLSGFDILPNCYNKAVRTFEEICRRQGLDPQQLSKPEGTQRQQIIECQLAGSEEIFVQRNKRAYDDIRGDRRTLGRRSTVAVPMAHMVMGTAFDFIGLRSSGRNVRNFISGGSAITLEQVRTKLPHRLTERSSGYAISKKGALIEKKSFYFDGELHLGDAEETPSPTLATREALITAMMTGAGKSANGTSDTVVYKPETPNATEAIRQWVSAQKLEHRTSVNLNTAKRYESLIKKVIRQSLSEVPLDITDPAELDQLIPRVFLSSLVRPTRKKDIPEIVRNSPDAISLPVSDTKNEYLPINYKNNIAYITLTRDQLAQISREDFTQLLTSHDIKLRIGSGKYQQFEAAFSYIDELLKTKAEKKERRERSREAHDVLNSVDRVPSAERERTPVKLLDNEARQRSNRQRSLQRQHNRAAHLLLARGGTSEIE